MNIAQEYFDGLKKAYFENGGKKQWKHFETIMQGASKEDLENLRFIYPDIPDSLLHLLEIVDGTYWRKYDKGEVTLLFLGTVRK